MTTMADVARVVGVSIQTISAVINDKPGISPATRERVRQAIAQLDYHPNMLASGLRSRHSHSIGILVPTILNPYWPGIVRGAEDVAHRNGYAVFLCNTDGDGAKNDVYIQLLRRQRVGGILFTTGGSSEIMEQLTTSGIAVAHVGPQHPHEQAVSVGIDERLAGYRATAHLLDLGHRRIGFIAPADIAGQTRRVGYDDALRERSVAPDPALALYGEFDVPSGQEGARRLMVLPAPPTAIVAGNDLIAIGAITAIKRLGKRVPEDVAVIGFDNIEMAALYDPSLTTVAQPLYDMGAFAMQALLDRVRDPTLPGEQVIFDTPLIVRRSTVATGTDEEDP